MTTEALSAPPPPPAVVDVDRSPSITHASSSIVTATAAAKSTKSLSASPGKNYSPPKKVATAPLDDSSRSPDM